VILSDTGGAVLLKNGFALTGNHPGGSDGIPLEAPPTQVDSGQTAQRERAAICDIDERELPKIVADVEKISGKKPRTETDIRKVLDNKEIDAISIAAPNHWHALATIWACQAGKHVYVEKPVSYNIFEGRKMVEASRKYDRIVQTGTQNRTNPLVRSAMEFLHAGKLGKIYMVKCVVFRPRESLGHKPNSAVPPGVHMT
jgi:predicted dehydrogenase